MTTTGRTPPLRGSAVYNPALLNQAELKSLFVARRRVLERMLEDLRLTGAEAAPQHRLIVGGRGMGKTTLLHRMALALEEDAGLAPVWLPLLFPEEQYSVGCLGDFWLNCLDALGDALERRGQGQAAELLDQEVDRLHALPVPERTRQGLAALRERARAMGRRLVLLVDNVDLVLERASGEHWALREVLGHEPALLLIGASTCMLEETHTYDAAFYDFFKVDELRGLTLEESGEMLLALDALAREGALPAGEISPVRRLVEQDQPRLKALHLLSGGNPRTLVLLHGVLASGWGDGIRADLERLLDLSTPLYKARFEALPAQAQRVMDAVALHWHPITARQAADAAGLEVNPASSQLNRLHREGLVEKVALPGQNKTGFMVAERFFNIWYLMRASRRKRRSLIWLVEFLRLLYSQEELQQQAHHHLRGKGGGDLRWVENKLAVARALDRDRPERHALEVSALSDLYSFHDLRQELGDLVDLSGEDCHLQSQAERMAMLVEAKELVLAVPRGDESGAPEPAELWQLLGGSLNLSPCEKQNLARKLATMTSAERQGLVVSLRNDLNSWKKFFRHDARLEQVRALMREGKLDDRWSLEEVQSAMVALEAETGVPGSAQWLLLHALLQRANKGEDREELLSQLERLGFITQSLAWGTAWYWFGALLHVYLDRPQEAETAYREALRIDPNYAMAWNNLGVLLAGSLARPQEAEAAFRETLSINPDHAMAWNNLGRLLTESLARPQEAEAAYREAIRIDPNYAKARNNLAWLLTSRLGRHAEAEELARKAVALQPESPYFSHTLAQVLVTLGRWGEAEPWIERYWSLGDEACQERIWNDTLNLMRDILARGFGQEVVKLLDRTGMGERWLPLRGAMHALAEGNPDLLNALAPEVRTPARMLLEQLSEKPA